MQPQSLRPSRIAVMVAFSLSCFGLLLFLWLSFGGSVPLKPKGYRVDVLFSEATQLATQAEVRISGVPVGKVQTIERDGDRTRATVQLRSRYAPLPADARAVLRQKTLLGETYVELTPGSKGARKVPDGGTLPRRNVADVVDLDEVLRAFDRPSRRHLASWLQGFDRALAGRSADLNDSVGQLAPLAVDGGDVLATVAAQRAATQRLVRDFGTVLETVGERSDSTQRLVRAGATLLRTTARQRDGLRATLRVLPRFTLALRGATDAALPLEGDLVPALEALLPVARDLRPTLVRGAVLGDDLRGLAGDLEPALGAARTGLPGLESTLAAVGPALDRVAPLAADLVPIAAYLDAYRRPFTQSWAKAAAATQATAPSASGRETHYLRLTPPVWSEALATAGRRAAVNRSNPYPAPDALARTAAGAPEAFDCSHAGDTGTLPALGTSPPCRQQAPYSVGGDPARFPKLTPAP